MYQPSFGAMEAFSRLSHVSHLYKVLYLIDWQSFDGQEDAGGFVGRKKAKSDGKKVQHRLINREAEIDEEAFSMEAPDWKVLLKNQPH